MDNRTTNSHIVYRNPKFFWLLKIFFPALDRESSIITYGDTIYTKHPIPKDWEIHEMIHVRQQKGNKFYAFFYTIVFIFSRGFRFRMELEAFREQHRWNQDHFTGVGLVVGFQKHIDLILEASAKNLSGPLYKNLVSYDEAIKLIKNENKS